MRRQGWPRVGVAVLLVATVGCAHRPAPHHIVFEPRPDAARESKPDVGRVELTIATGSAPEIERPRIIGSGQGAKEGAKVGAVTPALAGLAFTGTVLQGGGYLVLAGLMLTAAGVAVAPVGAGLGAAIGAMTAPSEAEVERCAAALVQAVDDADLSNSLAAWIVHAAGSRPIGRAGDSAPPAADTLLQIDAPAVTLTSADPAGSGRDLQLRAWMSARLVRASDGEVLRTFSWSYGGPKATFFKWGSDDARMLRAELERAGRTLAASVVADLW